MNFECPCYVPVRPLTTHEAVSKLVRSILVESLQAARSAAFSPSRPPSTEDVGGQAVESVEGAALERLGGRRAPTGSCLDGTAHFPTVAGETADSTRCSPLNGSLTLSAACH